MLPSPQTIINDMERDEDTTSFRINNEVSDTEGTSRSTGAGNDFQVECRQPSTTDTG